MQRSFSCFGIVFFLLDAVTGVGFFLHRRTKSMARKAAVTEGLEDVIDILSQMLKDLNTQADEDKTNWQRYSNWSDQTEEDKHAFLRTQKGLEMAATASLNANKQMVHRLTIEVGEVAGDISQTAASLRELREMRSQEQKSFENSLNDVEKTIQAVERAAEILEGHYQSKDALLQEVQARVQMALQMYVVKPGSRHARAAQSLASLLQGGQPDWLSVKGDESYGSYQ